MVKVKQATLKTPEQQTLMQLISDALTKGEGPLKDLFGSFNQQEFEQGITQPALKNFQENILPQIQEKFIAGNQVLGSGMRRGQLKAAEDLQSQLAQLMYQAQQQQKQNRLQGIQSHIGENTFENIVQQPKQKSSIWESILPAAGSAVGSFLGPLGTAAGAAIGSAASKAIAG